MRVCSDAVILMRWNGVMKLGPQSLMSQAQQLQNDKGAPQCSRRSVFRIGTDCL